MNDHFLRFLLTLDRHNWPDKYAVQILNRIRRVALPHSKLLVVDGIVDYACRTAPSDIPGADLPSSPAPLLPHGGSNTLIVMDIIVSCRLHKLRRAWIDRIPPWKMMTLFNSLERTIDQWVSLFDAGGWKLTQVWRAPGLNQLLAEIK